MRCLFLFQDCPLSFNYSGSASRRTMDYEALCALDVDLVVVRLLGKHVKEEVLSYEKEYAQEITPYKLKARRWIDLEYSPHKYSGGKINSYRKLLFDPIEYFYPDIDRLTIEMEELIADFSPDLIWTGFMPSSVLPLKLSSNIAWVHYIGDWRHRLRLIRSSTPSGIFRGLVQRLMARAEYKIDKQILSSCSVIETASSIQAHEIKTITQVPVLFISQFYPSPEFHKRADADQPQIVHLGSLRTTSNLVGLRDYLTHIHSSVFKNTNLQLSVIGDSTNPDPLMKELLLKPGVNCTGRITRLEKVLSPYDIGIIPYNHNTGMRTKVALFHSYRMPVITFRKSVEGMSEVRHGHNAILVDSLEQFEVQLINLIKNPDLRKKLGDNGFETFLKNNSLQSQLPKYEKILKLATGNFSPMKSKIYE